MLTAASRLYTYQLVCMFTATKSPRNPADTRRKLLAAAERLMLRQGFTATTVDQVCAEAGLTKGSFFHYFPSKEAIGREAMGVFARNGMDLYAAAVGQEPDLDPLERLHRLLDLMAGLSGRSADPVVCMVGMLSQELAATNPSVREAGAEHLSAWTRMVARMLEDAKTAHPPRVDFDAESVAWMLNSLWQGSMLIAKTRQDPETISRNLRHGRAYVDSLFAGAAGDEPAPPSRTTGQRLAPRRKSRKTNRLQTPSPSHPAPPRIP